MNIAVVNRTNLKNYGSVLQVYALCAAVRKLGYESEVVWQSGNMSKNFDIRPNKVLKTFIKMLLYPRLVKSTLKTARGVSSVMIDEEKVRRFDAFVEANFQRSFYSPREIKCVAKSDKYQKFICGSDQVWSSTTLYPDPMMYLRFAPRGKRIAYAPSLGRNYIPEYNKRTIRKYISDIPFVSIREDDGKRLIHELSGRDVPVVADPTLLMRSAEWDTLRIDLDVPQDFVLCYFLDEPSYEAKEAICEYAKTKNKDIVILGTMEGIDYPHEHVSLPKVGPGEFLTLVSKSDMVITDSYHGMLFAINYHKKFWSVERAYSEFDQSSRQLTVLSRFGLEERYVKKDFCFTDEEVDYKSIQTKIDEFVAFSMKYLEESLKA